MRPVATETDLSGGRVKLSGSVNGGPGAGIRLEVLAEQFPYGRPVAVATTTTTTNADGRFSARVRPVLITRYRMRAADGQEVAGQSRSAPVLVFPRQRVEVQPYSARKARLLYEVEGPTNVGPEGGYGPPSKGKARLVYFYANRRGSRKYSRIAAARLSQLGCSNFCGRRARALARLTDRLVQSTRVLACTRQTSIAGLGLSDPACGRRTLTDTT